MFKRLYLALTACMLLSSSSLLANAQSCKDEGVKSVDLEAGQFCCCTEISETDAAKEFDCEAISADKLTVNEDGTKSCPGDTTRVNIKVKDKEKKDAEGKPLEKELCPCHYTKKKVK